MGEEKDSTIHPERLEIKHTKSPNFIDVYSNGAVILGPSFDDLYFLTFFADFAEVDREIATLQSPSDESGQATYVIGIDNNDIKSLREDKVRVTIRKDSLIRLRELLNRQEL